MKLLDTRTQEVKEADIVEVEKEDYDYIEESDQFEFDWKKEGKNHQVYKIHLSDEQEEILGLIAINDVNQEFRIHVNLLEVAKRNIGKNKIYDRIAGCLLAFACELAFDRSYGGFVSLTPKTALINHYCKQYGFRQFGRQLAVDYMEALAIIKKYS